MRTDSRKDCELREISILPDYTKTAGGSALISWGNTRVLCTALLESGTMPFLKNTGKGWLTAEYAMLPSSTGSRKKRGTDGRATEIQRLIGRSLRESVDLMRLGENVIYVDCDVLQADGGTRTASITGAYVAVRLGIKKWLREGRIPEDPFRHQIAAVSAGIVDDRVLLDLCGASCGIDDHHIEREQAQYSKNDQDDINKYLVNGISASFFKTVHLALLSFLSLIR